MENQISILFVRAHGRAPLPEPFLAKIMKYTPNITVSTVGLH